MDASLKKILRAISLELRHTLEGSRDEAGTWHPGDLARRLEEPDRQTGTAKGK